MSTSHTELDVHVTPAIVDACHMGTLLSQHFLSSIIFLSLVFCASFEISDYAPALSSTIFLSLAFCARFEIPDYLKGFLLKIV